jgi:ATP-dependent Clp protease ATP-binding subunit ClpA
MFSARDRDDIGDAVRDFFDPEFLNRLERVVHFGEISRRTAAEIVRLQLDDALVTLARRGVESEVADGVVEALVSTGFDAVYGARSLRRAMRRHVLVPAAELLVAGRSRGLEEVRIRLEPADDVGGLRVRPAAPGPTFDLSY